MVSHSQSNGGIAYLATPSSNGAGICAETSFNETENFFHTANTGLIFSGFDNKKRTLSKLFIITTHEIGHSFGSSNDPYTDIGGCTLGGKGGDYIMFEMESSFSEPNSRIFSPCSRRRIAKVIEKKGTDCLEPYKGGKCGDRVVSSGEECDCGTKEICEQSETQCCTPPGGAGSDKECTFRRELGKVCDPLEPCCDINCTLVPAKSKQYCLEGKDDCNVSYCDGKSSKCPPPTTAENGTQCNYNSMTCQGGQCVSDICKDKELENCKCTAESGRECHVCCEIDGSCQSARMFASGNHFRAPGEPCFNGSCNSLGNCYSESVSSAEPVTSK